MKNILRTRFHIWLALVMIALALLTLAFQGGGDEVDPAHCRPCVTRTFTPTPTPTQTPLPPLQSCRIQEIYFNERLYNPGETITATVGMTLNVTVKLVDHQGQILTGANVDATVTQTNTVQTAAVIPPLVDQSGTYDGVYTPQSQGLYLFRFSASDSGGPRFSPCEAQARVQVVGSQVQQCQIMLEANPTVRQQEPITVTARVRVGGAERCDALVGGIIRHVPGGGPTSISFPASCPYTGIIPGTSITGTYAITASAQDRNGGNSFAACTSSELQVSVVPTSTVTPAGVVRVDLEEPQLNLCGRQRSDTSSTIVAEVANLAEVDLTLTYDPTFIRPSQITQTFATGTVTQTGNTIRYVASRTAPVSGLINLLGIDWRLQGRDGVTTIALTSNLRNLQGGSIQHTSQNGTLTITIGSPCRAGTAVLQGRTDHSGITVAGSAGEQTQTYPNGLFAITPGDHLSFSFDGYLPVQVGLPEGQAAGLGTITLLAGDVNSDQVINILDLAYLAQRFQSADVTADLNADGTVDILDLALVAGNYQQQGPLATRK